jgi:toxin CptA
LSIASSSCRIDWRPSRRLCLALATLGLLGAGCVLLSDLPVAARALLAPAATAYGLWLARRESKRPPCELELDGEGGVLMRRGAFEQVLSSPRLRLRGSLASLDGRADGRRESWVWCADTLSAEQRRQLFLRLGGRTPA